MAAHAVREIRWIFPDSCGMVFRLKGDDEWNTAE